MTMASADLAGPGRLLGYRHCFIVDAPLELVAAFHARSSSMAAITPPGIVVQVHQAPPVLQSGDEMRFSLRLGGVLPIPWVARITGLGPDGFIDSQTEGPFAFWQHEHRFLPLGPDRTVVVDLVEARLQRHWLQAPLGLAMWLGMPLLFAYRARRTRQLLRSEARG